MTGDSTDEDGGRPGGTRDRDGGRDIARGDRVRGDASLAAVQRAAIDRALVDPGSARRALALAGALDGATSPGERGARPSPVTTALVSVAAVAGLRAAVGDAPPTPATPVAPAGDAPGEAPRDVDDLIARGAAVATRRPDVDLADAAALAALPTDRVRAARRERAGDGPADG